MQVSLLVAIAVAYDVPAAALIGVAAASLMVAHARYLARREPRLVPKEVATRRVVADFARMSRRLAREARLQIAPRPMVIPGLPTLFVLRTSRPRLVMSSGLINAVSIGRLRREQIEPLIAHEIAHLTDISGLWGEVLTMAVRLTVVAGLIGLPLSVIVPGSSMTSGEMLIDLGIAVGALLINGLLFGSWMRTRELRADLGGRVCLASKGACAWLPHCGSTCTTSWPS